MREALLMVHPTIAALAIAAVVWVFVDTLNVTEATRKRISLVSTWVAILMGLVWITSGYWYVVYYAADKAIILNGPWPFAHNLVMETKEHVFFITLLLSFLLPIVTRTNDLVRNVSARTLVYTVTALIFLSSFAIEGGGAIISMAVRMGLISSGLH